MMSSLQKSFIRGLKLLLWVHTLFPVLPVIMTGHIKKFKNLLKALNKICYLQGLYPCFFILHIH